MKHIKVFENFEYFTEISEDEFLSDDGDLVVVEYDIDIKEANIILSLIKNEFKFNWDRNTGTIEISVNYYDDFYLCETNCTWTIYQSKDEWFYIRKMVQESEYNYYNNYIKCDQFDGLLKYLKNEGIIK